MFDWVSSIGPNTWAFIVLLLFMGAVAVFVMTKGVTGYIIGGVLYVGALGALAHLVAFRGSSVPVLDTPWGITAAMVGVLLIGINLISSRKELQARGGGGGNFRDQVPSLNTKAILIVTVAIVMIGVALTFFADNLNLELGGSDRGVTIAQNQTGPVYENMFRSFEEFLAR